MGGWKRSGKKGEGGWGEEEGEEEKRGAQLISQTDRV